MSHPHRCKKRAIAQDAAGDVARAVLQPALEHLAHSLATGRSPLAAELHNPLSQLPGVPYFPLTRRNFLGQPRLPILRLRSAV